MKGESGIRFNILIVFILMIGIIFIFQLYNLQIVNGASYREQSENRLVREIKVTAPRGEIYDRYGKLIVTSVTGYNVNLYYTKIPKTELNVGLLKLANILEKNGDTYYVYPSTDGFDNWTATQFHVFSSKDLYQWKSFDDFYIYHMMMHILYWLIPQHPSFL